LEEQQEKLKKQVKSNKKKSGVSNEDHPSDDNIVEDSNSDDYTIPLDEQLSNANQ
jgi:hypothetical protein